MDSINIVNAKYQCKIGVSREEKKRRRTVHVDLIVYADLKGLRDDIHRTIDYSSVNKDIKAMVENREYNLIETMAEQISKLVLKKYPVKKITVLVKKPSALKNADYASVKITRAR